MLDARIRSKRPRNMAGDMVECADRVYRQDGGAGRGLRGGAQQARDSFRASGRAQPELKRETSVLQLWGKLLGQDASNKATQHISDDRSTHAAVGPTQGNDASDPDGSKDRSGQLCAGELLSSAMQQTAILLVIQHDAKMLVGSPGRACRGPPPSRLQACDKGVLRKRTWQLRREVRHLVTVRAVRFGWPPVRVAQLSERCQGPLSEGFSREGAARCRQLTQVDKSLGSVGSGLIIRGDVAAGPGRAGSASSCCLTEQVEPVTGLEGSVATAKLCRWNARHTGFPV